MSTKAYIVGDAVRLRKREKRVYLKSRVKRLLGRLISVDVAEKLTEYSLAAREPAVSLAHAEPITTGGMSWNDVVEAGREILWRCALDTMAADALLFVEFGVWQGRSIEFIAGLNTSATSRFVGFDSFEGLPEEWRGTSAGHFSTGGKIPQIGDPRVRFVKGWFQETLPGELDAIQSMAEDRTLLVHFDADLYSSTLYLLCTLTPRFSSFYCIFDEFAGHEMRALYNFIQAYGARCEFFAYVPWRGDATATFARLTMPGAPQTETSGLAYEECLVGTPVIGEFPEVKPHKLD